MEFAILRAPFTVGAAPSCLVNIRLDESVRPEHARASVLSDGYRVRGCGNAAVYVNGKRAGAFKSRVARSGDIMRIGCTSLVLECAPDGLARRSRGIMVESDAVWALRQTIGGLYRVVKWIVLLPVRLCRGLLGRLLTTGILILLLYFALPPLRGWLNSLYAWLRWKLSR